MPLTREQFAAALLACDSYNPKAPDKEWRRQRARAMLLLLRWSGLRLRRCGQAGSDRRLPRRGSLRHIQPRRGRQCWFHCLGCRPGGRRLESDNPRYFLWGGSGPLESTVKRWWSTLKAIFRAAGIPDIHPHQLRDTFAVEYLLAGVPLEQVSILLGHSSVKITEKHYAPWVKARQVQLENSVRSAWESA